MIILYPLDEIHFHINPSSNLNCFGLQLKCILRAFTSIPSRSARQCTVCTVDGLVKVLWKKRAPRHVFRVCRSFNMCSERGKKAFNRECMLSNGAKCSAFTVKRTWWWVGGGDTRSDNAVMMVSLLPEVCLQQEQDNVLPVGSHFQCCRV